ncbi:hypothetical protein Tco_0932091 [Tanacetum coccineum]
MDKRKKYFAKLRAEEKRRKPLTQAQRRKQMSTYLKNMAGYTLKQLKGNFFKEIKEAFERIMKQIKTFEPMDKEVEGKEKEAEGSKKRESAALEQESSKRQKLDEEDETEELK